MRASAKGLIGLIMLLASSVAASADPITYTMSGEISFLGGAREHFVGSFDLSDPTIDLFDLSDSRGVQRDSYTVDAFALTSASYSLSGTGMFVAWWGRFGDFNPIDSILSIATPGQSFETLAFSCCTWTGTPGAQPTQIFSSVVGEFGEPYRLHNFTAAPSVGVPEPSTLLLYSLGIIGLASFRRPTRATRTLAAHTKT